MSYIETGPASGVLFIGAVLLALVGFLTLTGTWSIILWLLFVAVVAMVVYFVGYRVVQWGRGESMSRRRDASPERESR